MATTFTLFPQLLPNVRSKIWRCSLPLFPRIIELKSTRSSDELCKKEPPRWIAIPTSKPTLLSINRESRRILSPLYATPFQALRISPHLGIESLLINYEIDTLFINMDFQWGTNSDMIFTNLFGSNFVEVRDNLKRLAGTEPFWDSLIKEARGGRTKRDRANSKELLANFSNLEEAIVVTKSQFPERPATWRLIQFVDLHERSEEWRRVKHKLPPFFDPYQKKRYFERLYVKIERPPGLWK